MQIDIKFPEENDKSDVQPYVNSTKRDRMTEEEQKILNQAVNVLGDITKIGYSVDRKVSLISVEKKDGYLHVEINDNYLSDN